MIETMGHALTDSEADGLRRMLIEQGVDVVASRFELNSTTLLRAAVGLPLHNATRLVISQRLTDERRD